MTQFATASEELAPPTLVTGASLGLGGVLRDAVASYYNPKPPRPSGVDWYRYDGSGIPTDAGNFDKKNQSSSEQYTNWDTSLK